MNALIDTLGENVPENVLGNAKTGWIGVKRKKKGVALTPKTYAKIVILAGMVGLKVTHFAESELLKVWRKETSKEERIAFEEEWKAR